MQPAPLSELAIMMLMAGAIGIAMAGILYLLFIRNTETNKALFWAMTAIISTIYFVSFHKDYQLNQLLMEINNTKQLMRQEISDMHKIHENPTENLSKE